MDRRKILSEFLEFSTTIKVKTMRSSWTLSNTVIFLFLNDWCSTVLSFSSSFFFFLGVLICSLNDDFGATEMMNLFLQFLSRSRILFLVDFLMITIKTDSLGLLPLNIYSNTLFHH
jgi:hypothetical protein